MFTRKKASSAGRALIVLGRIVRRLGRLVGGKIGAGIMGYGLAHIVLGNLAKFSSEMRSR